MQKMNWYLYHATLIGNWMPPAVAPIQTLRVYNVVFDHLQDELVQRRTG